MTTTALTLHVGTYRNHDALDALTWAEAQTYGGIHFPIFAHIATPAADLSIYNGPEATLTGPVCGSCSDTYSVDGEPRVQVRHATVEHVRTCHALAEEAAAQQAADIWAEGAYLRYAEGGWDTTGAYSAELEDPRYTLV